MVYVERVIETSKKGKPRLVTKTAWVVASSGVKSTPAPVSTPGRKEGDRCVILASRGLSRFSVSRGGSRG